MNYRLAISEDIDHLSELFDGYRLFYRKTTDLEGAKTFLEHRISKQDSKLFVAETDENTLVGFVQLYPLFSSTRMKKFWLLNDLFVHPEFRGKGVAIELIQRAKALVLESKACGMFLETKKSNLIGNTLYPKTGFVLNTDSNYYEWSVE